MSNEILIIEDEDIVADDIAEILESAGYALAGRADNGEDAIELAKETSPDLILMDIKINGSMDGIEAADQIRKFADIPVIFLTAFADKETLARAKLTQPQAYLVKPYKEIDLLTTIDLALFRNTIQANAKETPVKIQADSSGKLSAETFAKHQSLHKVGSDKHSEIFSHLQKGQYLNNLPLDTLSELATYCDLKIHDSGQFVIFEGDNNSNCFLVASGRVAVVKASGSGKELIVELLPPGDGFGLISSLDKQPYPYSLRSQTDSELVWMPRDLLLNVLEHFPNLFKNILEDVFARLRGSHNISRALAHDRVELRVASAIIALVPKLAKDADDKPEIKMTRQELADLVGTSQETCIRITKALERDGMLDLAETGKIVVNNLDALNDLISEAS
ncbi:MAG: response regulator [Bdellovibrionales bacterium]|nr:response regulator [Bdellovibrionales bacterium]